MSSLTKANIELKVSTYLMHNALQDICVHKIL